MQESEEAASARSVLRQLDKASRAARTYGLDNAVSQRFFEQLAAEFEGHLGKHTVLGVVVDRTELRLYDEVVYQSEDSVGESLAFRLFSDGIRELRFSEGLDRADLRAFIEALWALTARNEEDEDDDVVTRLWAKDIPTISFVTAEDIVQAPWMTQELQPQEHGYFAPPPPSFKPIAEAEKKSAEAPMALPPDRAPGGVVGYEVSDAEREQIQAERLAEQQIDGTQYALGVLRTILAVETAPDLLTRALALMPEILDWLLRTGGWETLVQVLDTLDTAGAGNPAFEQTHRMIAARVIDSLNVPARLSLIEEGLNSSPNQSAAQLAAVLGRLHPSSVATLCAVLGNVTSPEHRALLKAAIVKLGVTQPEPVLKGLGDARPQLVRDLIDVLAQWAQPQAAEVLAMLAHHADVDVRRDAANAAGTVRPKGDGAPLVAFASDADRGIRLHVLRLLGGGHYAAEWEAWKPHLKAEEILELPLVDKRSLFHAMRATSGDAAAPFLGTFLGARGWSGRHKKEETALAAVDVLEMLGSAAAHAALEHGKAEGSAAIREACASALDGLARRKGS